MNCGSCDFWKPDAGDDPVLRHHLGECHRHAPAVEKLLTGTRLVVWPRLLAENFCGDYQRHPLRRIQAP